MDSRTAKPGNFSYEAEDGLLFRMLTKEDAAEVAALEKNASASHGRSRHSATPWTTPMPFS